MPFELPPLPYALDALAPAISEETLSYHHGKHHQTYVNKLNELVANTPYEKQSLEEIILNAEGGIFNNAAQVWNHTFYWHSMTPDAKAEPQGEFAERINKDFGSIAQFKQDFTNAALTQFGSGWAWLVADKDGKLSIIKTSNAGNPMTEGKTPLLTCDVWEHAYYIDTRNNRAQYLDNFWKLVNWEFGADNLGKTS